MTAGRFAFAISLAFVAAGALLVATGETARRVGPVFGGAPRPRVAVAQAAAEAVRRTSFDGEPAFLFPYRASQGVVVLAGLAPVC